MKGLYHTVYKDQFSMDTEGAPGGVVVYYADGDEEIIHVNKYVVELFECESAEDFMELVQGSFRHFVYKDDLDVVEDSIWGQVDRRDGFDHVYYRIQTKTGRLLTVTDFGKLVANPDGGRPVFQVFVAKVTQTATIDWLTGLPSMARFHELARMGAHAIAARGERPVAVSLDIMGMKTFNARYGREEGDRLLVALADALRRQFGNEACSRVAEDHYYAFSAESDIEQRLKSVFDEFGAADFGRVPPVRAGVYALDADDDIVGQGFDRAKLACDLDRKTWQSHLTWYTDEMRLQARLRIHVLESLDQAIASGWIRPFYQAIVRAATGEICNEEALARWIDPEYGMIMPDQFIPDLEEAGLLHKLDLHIVDCVIEDILTKRREGVPVVPVSMNFSLRDLMRLDLAKEIARRADAAGIPRGLLRIELTESVASSDPVFLRKQVAAMHAAGFEVWMDDFGSGYSSLNTLQEFDFDLIKLDMGFLRGSNPERSRVILAGVVQAASKLGVGTLTEGVETEEQASFLEDIGCDMLQGYHYARPNELSSIVEDAHGPHAAMRERYAEVSYWDAVSLLGFSELEGTGDSSGMDWAPLMKVPIGVVEYRRGVWRVLRANSAYREFLDKTGMLSAERTNLAAHPLERDIDPEFVVAAKKSKESATWERIGSRMEYGTGFQFHVRHVASTADADAYQVAAVPTMLGAGLGLYGDVPVSYAVFRVILNEDRTRVVDSEYVFANDMYCEMCGVSQREIMGRSFLEVMENASEVWFPSCYRAVVGGERVHDIVYSPEIGHWMSFYLAPTPIEDCCVYAFAIADDERREQEEMLVGLDTSAFIIGLADVFNGETNYEKAMNGLLEQLTQAIHPDRLYIYERGQTITNNTFEWCAPGVEPQIGNLQNMDNEDFCVWDAFIAEETVVLIPDVSKLKSVSESAYLHLAQQNIQRMLAVPLYNHGELVGYLGADNYVLDESLDTRRLLETVASFVGGRIANHRLMEMLERIGTYDELTGMRNRRGVDLAIDELLTSRPGEPYALALMDIDDFKVLNDVNGHAVGDEALKLLADIVMDALPAGTVVGRNGGDEFVAMLYGEDACCVEDALNAITVADKSFELEGKRYTTSLSIGYVRCPEQTSDLRSAYTMADTALYAVKLSGKSGYRKYSPDMEMQYRMEIGFTLGDVAKNVPGGIVVHLPGDDKILFANDELIDMFECTSLSEFMEYVGGTYGGIVHPDDRERVRRELASQMTFDDIGHKDFVDFRIRTKKGNVYEVADNGRLVYIDGIGSVFYELIVNRDERVNR